jgi:membrane protein YdbS with pleckstrin-like domain
MNLAFLVTNIVGAVVYVMASSRGWAIPQEREAGFYSVTGEPFIWAIAVVPIWALFSLLNLIWAAIIVRRKQWRDTWLWVVTACIWLVGAAVDFAHH